AARLPATTQDPVVLNAASESELRRLPGIGAKRAGAILALRARLGRFRAIEDLLKVKGIGRATLKRLRPLVRLDALVPDGGPPSSASSGPPPSALRRAALRRPSAATARAPSRRSFTRTARRSRPEALPRTAAPGLA
ncbi:MAG: ComEA family DNA-binding protein, partial [Myxococcales bacterium]|nr:ComEA family DNA-binding protein [Myxococcales bacterium]